MHERQDGHFGGTGDSSAPRALVGNQGPQGSKGPRGEPGNKGVFQGPRGGSGEPRASQGPRGTPELPAPTDQPILGTTTNEKLPQRFSEATVPFGCHFGVFKAICENLDRALSG